MKIDIFEIESRENKVYQELLEQYKTNKAIKKLLNVHIIPPEITLMGDLRLITVLDRVIDNDGIKVFLVKDTDKNIFLWVIGVLDLDSGLEISMFPLLKKQSKKLQLEIRNALIEKELIKEKDEN